MRKYDLTTTIDIRPLTQSLFDKLRCFVPATVAPDTGIFQFYPPSFTPHTLPCPPPPLPITPPSPPSRSSTAWYHHHIPTHPSLLPLCHLTQVQNWSLYNILRNCILPLPNVGLQWLKPRLISHHLRQGGLPSTVWNSPWQPTRQLSQHLILEPPQDPHYAGGNQPLLRN